MILIIDNYDSFTYNLVQLFQSRGEEVVVKLNDAIDIESIRSLNPDGILLSPGPCTPKEAGICVEVVKELYDTYPILGVCLGHQVIGEAFGSKVINAGRILHVRWTTLTIKTRAYSTTLNNHLEQHVTIL